MLTSLEKWKKFSSAILYLFQIFLSFKVLQDPVQTSKTYPSKTECERKINPQTTCSQIIDVH